MKKLALLFIILIPLPAFPQKVKVSYTDPAFSQPFTGNVFLYLSKYNKNPKDGQVNLEMFPCFSVSAKNIKPGTNIMFDDNATSYPVKLSELERGEYFVQAVWDRNLGGHSIAESPGNIYSQPVKVVFLKNRNKTFTINCDQIIPEQIFAETELIKEFKVESNLLTKFNSHPTTINAAVILPEEYIKALNKRFPVVFIVYGYGGDYYKYSLSPASTIGLGDSISCIRVILDGNCPLGHSVYANSENNGPWGDAFVKEFIPELEKEFRCNGARLITGHSSGGWSSLWLQTHYPDVFAGCWSSAPDEVDFRSFCNSNIYRDRNFYYSDNGDLKYYATVEGRFPWTYMKDVYQQENVISRGEQMHSYEAVFSKKDNNGFAERICNPNTGEIDTLTVEHWKAYDISLYLRTNWGNLKNDLIDKVRVSVGEQDNWNLNIPVHMLENEMQKLDSKFEFAYYPGGHSTVLTKDYRMDGMKFLMLKYKEWLDK